MASFLSKPEYKNNSGRNGFDVGRRRIFTSPCGMLLPVYDDFANPGDHYKLNSTTFIRTEALETAAFMRLKLHVDWFFVPITQLYRFWNEFFNMTQDIDTSFISNSKSNNFALPTLDIWSPFTSTKQVSSLLDGFSQSGDNSYRGEAKVDVFGTPLAWNFRRLYDLFGFGSVDSTNRNNNSNSTDPLNIFPGKYLAYHKIWFSHYNNSQFFKNDSRLFNVDSYFGGNIASGTSTPIDILTTIHYRPYRRDIFTNIQPAPTFNFSFVNSQLPSTFNSGSLYMSNFNFDSIAELDLNDLPSGNILKPDISLGGTGLEMSDPGSSGGGFGTGDLRSLFAFDKLMRITASSGSHYDQQTLAHFGYKIPQGIQNDAYFLGSQDTDININEVVATASTGYDGAGSTIGDIAGKGFGMSQGSKDIDFTAPCHGYIMALSSIEPIADYASKGCEAFNRFKDPFDFYRPEFDNIGMVPLFDAFFNSNSATLVNSSNLDGWTYRYYNLKSKFDVVNEGFWNTSKSSWVGTKQSLYGNSYQPQNFSPRLESLFFIAPQYTNPIFAYSYPSYSMSSGGGALDPHPLYLDYDSATPANIFDGTHTDKDGNVTKPFSANNVYSYDSFLLNMDIKAFKTSIMSVHSLPKFL